MIPVVAVMLALAAQLVVLVRDELRVLHAVRVGARSAVVDPDPTAVREALADAGLAGGGLVVRISGTGSPGELVEVEVSAPPTQVPLVGALVSRIELRERAVAMVE